MNKVLIIAEAGVNHNGDLSLAKQLIDAAAEAGADYVKFQTFKTENLVSVTAKQAEYQKANIGDSENDSQFKMLKKLELTHSHHEELISHCASRKIKFLSTAFDMESIDLLVKLGIDLYKVPSGEITNLPYLRKIGSLNKPVILSTGMCVMQEVKAAVKVLEDAGTKQEDITILHCTTDYPTAMKDVNLRAMLSLQKETGCRVGYSDHTLGIEVPVAAVAMGAEVIEKHFTLDRNLKGPDHKASLEPSELKEMIRSIRNVEVALGSGTKGPSEAERKNMLVARKSVHLASSLKAGHVIAEKDLAMKRPGDGISPMELEKVIGKKLLHDLNAEHKLSWSDLA
jgi:N,N'-diacetyllegionaminate synthase